MSERIEYQQDPSADILAISDDESAYLYDVMVTADKDLSAIISFNKTRYGNLSTYLANRDRVKSFEVELLEDYTNISSSLTAGRAFQKLHAELTTEYQVAHEEIVDIYQKLLSEYLRHPEIPLHPNKIDTRTRKQIITFFEKQMPPPTWWRGGTINWQNYMWTRLNFHNYIHEDLGFNHVNKPNHIIPQCYLHFVDPEFLPDWYEGMKQKPAEQLLEEVDQEFNEDLQVKDKLYTDISNVPATHKKLFDYFNEKSESYNAWILEKANLMEQIGFKDFKSFLIYIPTLLASFNAEHFDITTKDGFNNALDKLYELYAENRAVDKDIIALWLAHNCNDLHIGQTNGIPVSIVATALRAIKDPESLGKVWLPLKEENKQLYKFLRFNVGSLLASASQEEIEILAEYLETLPLSTSLKEIGKSIAEYSEQITQLSKQDSNTNRTVKNVHTFIKQWLSANQERYRNRIIDTLKSPAIAYQYARTKHINTELLLDDLSTEQGPFTQWNLFYTTNINNPTGAFISEIKGNSTEEITTSLEKLLRSQGISISVKISSIINCLEQIVNTPPEIEQLTPHLGNKHSDIDYKKRKRGKVRILYTIDPNNKNLTFWLHQKKQQSYRLN